MNLIDISSGTMKLFKSLSMEDNVPLPTPTPKKKTFSIKKDPNSVTPTMNPLHLLLKKYFKTTKKI